MSSYFVNSTVYSFRLDTESFPNLALTRHSWRSLYLLSTSFRKIDHTSYKLNIVHTREYFLF